MTKKVKSIISREAEEAVKDCLAHPYHANTLKLMFKPIKDLTDIERYVVSKVWPTDDKTVKSLEGAEALVDVRTTVKPEQALMIQVMIHVSIN